MVMSQFTKKELDNQHLRRCSIYSGCQGLGEPPRHGSPHLRGDPQIPPSALTGRRLPGNQKISIGPFPPGCSFLCYHGEPKLSGQNFTSQPLPLYQPLEMLSKGWKVGKMKVLQLDLAHVLIHFGAIYLTSSGPLNRKFIKIIKMCVLWGGT